MAAADRVMQAVQYDRYGGPEELEVRTVPVPAPTADQLLVRVAACGLNPADAFIRAGALRRFTGRRFPRWTGLDLVGEVVELGDSVDDLSRGQRVWGFLGSYDRGTAAEYVAVRRAEVAPPPERIGTVEAAALPLVGTTALQALRDRARLQPGERVLIKGASGGVGSAAIQIATAMGAHVTAAASGPNLEHCRGLGADEVVDYTATDPADLDARFDVVLDCYGGSPLRRYARLLTRGGRFVTIAPTPGLLLVSILSRLLPIPRVEAFFAKPNAADLTALARLVDDGTLRMAVMATYTLDQIREAHVAVAERHARGKRVLLVDPDAGRQGADEMHEWTQAGE
jgi:NADPH:quinone reductase-like Zn-dependent oxidoreductase